MLNFAKIVKNRHFCFIACIFILGVTPEQIVFQQCRLLFSQLGLAGGEKRRQIHLLSKTERLIRELKNLDTQRCRETHKVYAYLNI